MNLQKYPESEGKKNQFSRIIVLSSSLRLMTQSAMVFGPSYEHLRKMLKIEKLKNEKQMTKIKVE